MARQNIVWNGNLMCCCRMCNSRAFYMSMTKTAKLNLTFLILAIFSIGGSYAYVLLTNGMETSRVILKFIM